MIGDRAQAMVYPIYVSGFIASVIGGIVIISILDTMTQPANYQAAEQVTTTPPGGGLGAVYGIVGAIAIATATIAQLWGRYR